MIRDDDWVFINPRRCYSYTSIWRYINPVIPPIGLATLAGVLERGGHRVKIIDAHAEQLGDDDIKSRIGAPEFIGITATTPEIDEAKRLAVMLRVVAPKAKIIMGGVHPSEEHEALVAGGWCDAVVRGEGEIPVSALANGTAWSDIDSLTWYDCANGRVVINQDGLEKLSMDDIPFPAYHLLPMHKYRPALGAAKRTPAMGIITSRGCPGGCSFCVSGSSPDKTRYTSPARIIEHIEFLMRNYGIREILFYDDTFTGSRQRVENFCGLLMEKKIDISWVCFARVDAVTRDLLKIIKKAGCHQISYGIESPDSDVLRYMNKNIKPDRVREAVALARAERLDVRGAFMIGAPGETKSSMARTIKYAIRLKIDYAMFNITTPFPGTQLYKQAQEHNWLGHKNWKEYDLAHPVLNLPNVTHKQVVDAYRSAYFRFYFNPMHLFRRLTQFALRRFPRLQEGMFGRS